MAGAFAALAGTWTGTLLIENAGPASGVVSIDASGLGNYFVTLAGAKQSGLLQLLSFTGTTLRARAVGQERSLPASLVGDTLRLEVPELGEVVLRRSP